MHVCNIVVFTLDTWGAKPNWFFLWLFCSLLGKEPSIIFFIFSCDIASKIDITYILSLHWSLLCSISSQVNGNLTVDGIDYYITDNFGEGLYDSCKEVKFGTMNTRAMEFIGAGAKNFKGNPLCCGIFINMECPLFVIMSHCHFNLQLKVVLISSLFIFSCILSLLC